MLGSNPSRMAGLGATVNGLPDDPYGSVSMPAAQPDFSSAPPVPIQGQAMPSAPLAPLPHKGGFKWLTFGQNFINNYAAAQGSQVAQGWLKNQYDNEANSADQESKMKMMLARLQQEQNTAHLTDGVFWNQAGGHPNVIGSAPQRPAEQERLLARFMDPNTPEPERGVIRQMLMHPQLITQEGADGSRTQTYAYPDQLPGLGAQHPPMPSLPQGWTIEPHGGPTPRGAGTFPGGR